MNNAQAVKQKAVAEFAKQATLGSQPGKPDTYKGWSLYYDPPPIPCRNDDWQATGPNYDAWQEGESFVSNGEAVSAATRDELIAEIDIWIEENQ